MNPAHNLPDWPATLSRTLDSCRRFRRAIVLTQVDSTQDFAKRFARVGDVITTGRQTAGRGTHGRAWLDTANASLAVTICLPPMPAERFSVGLGVAVASCLQIMGVRGVGLKWPNDVLIDGRKTAGILVEQIPAHADVPPREFAGIGINIGPIDWPADLRDRAISLAETGVNVTRIQTLTNLLHQIDATLDLDDATLCDAWARFDHLTGRSAGFRIGHRAVSGIVERIDPMKGLSILTDDGPEWLPANATTRVDDGE